MSLTMHVSDLPLFANREAPAFINAPSTPLEVRYARWYANNPYLFSVLERLALKQYREGSTRLSIAKMVEELRTDSTLRSNGEPFAWNNSYRSFAARHLMWAHPELDGLFEIRKQTNHQHKEHAA